jgi:hypothetical protein
MLIALLLLIEVNEAVAFCHCWQWHQLKNAGGLVMMPTDFALTARCD